MRGVHGKEQIKAYNLKSRIVTRIGALLAKKVALSEVILETLADGDDALSALIMDREFLRKADRIDQSQLDELTKSHDPTGDTLSALKIVDGEQPGCRVICLEEELLAEDAWRDGALDAQPVESGKSQPEQTGRTDSNLVVRGSGAELASSAEAGKETEQSVQFDFDRQRMVLLTSAEISRRIEALRKIAFSHVSVQQKSEIFLHALGDDAKELRIESAKRLIDLGFSEDISLALTDLYSDDIPVRENAIKRLGVLAGKGSDLELGAVALSVLTRLREEDVGSLRRDLLEVLIQFGVPLARQEARIRQVMRLLINLLGNHPDEVWHPAFNLVNLFIKANPDLMRDLLWEELDRSVRRDIEAFLLGRLAAVVRQDESGRKKLAQKCAYYIATDKEAGRDSRLVGTVLTSLESDGVDAIRDAFRYAGDVQREYMLRLLDEVVRFHNPTEEMVRIAGEMVLDSIDVGKRALRLAAMETVIAMNPLCPPELAGKLADAYLAHIDDFMFPSDIENAENIVAHIGLPAVDRLLGQIGYGAPAKQQGRAVRILGELGRLLKIHARDKHADRIRRTLDDILRRLQQLSMENTFEMIGEVYVSMGKVAGSDVMSPETLGIVAQHLMGKARDKNNRYAHRAVEGLSWLCTSRRMKRANIDKTRKILIAMLESDKPELTTEVTYEDDEPVFTIGDGVEMYTENIPIGIDGLVRIALAPNAGEKIPRDITKYLIDWWFKLIKGKEIWGPSNMTRVADGLRDLGKWKKTSPVLRIEILKALVKRVRQMSVLVGISEILRSDDTPIVAPIAQTVLREILNWRDDNGAFDFEDREYIVRAIGNLLHRHDWTGEDRFPHLRDDAVEQVFRALQDDVNGAYDVLISLQAEKSLPDELQKKLIDRLSRYGAIIMM